MGSNDLCGRVVGVKGLQTNGFSVLGKWNWRYVSSRTPRILTLSNTDTGGELSEVASTP